MQKAGLHSLTQHLAIELAEYGIRGNAAGARSKQLLIRDEDVQVLHGFDTKDNANAYLTSELLNNDVVEGLKPIVQSAPDVRIYQVA